MIRKLVVVVFLVASTLVVAQSSTTNLTVRESAEYTDTSSSQNILGIHTTKEGKTIIVRSAKREYIFDVFDQQLQKVFFKTVKKEKKEDYVSLLFNDTNVKLFTVFSPKKEKRIVFSQTLDINKNTYKKTTIFETTVEKKQSLFSSRRSHKTSFSLSPNGNYFAIATDNIKKNKNSYTIRVFNTDTETLVYKKAYQESTDKKFIHNDLLVDNYTNVYSLGKLFLKGKTNLKANGDANYQFVLNKISKDSTEELLIKLEEEHIQSLSLFEEDNQLHLIGFYSEMYAGKIKGGCDFIIDTESFKIKNKKTNELPKQVYEDLYSYRKAERKKKKKKELANFSIDYVLTDDNGAKYLIAEEFYITQVYVSTGNGMGYWQTIYHFDDILILKFNSNGDLLWGRSIFKRATTPSYNAFLKNNQLHIILNSGKNLTTKTDGRTKVSKGLFESTSLYDIEFTTNGGVSYNKIRDNKNNKFYTPYYGTFEQNRFIMISRGKNKKSFMILE